MKFVVFLHLNFSKTLMLELLAACVSDEERLAVLHLLFSLSKNTEVLSESLTAILPFIFLYKCQEGGSFGSLVSKDFYIV